ncbi:MAG TPA: FUSC family protein [Solirubrobacteraceae bacterium]|jgi:uncharacterized membrane protein YgaE (UPF0421/DUF939 family)|nr:FUSC family protein [Solirubrobacteraceae bacterium]
MSAAFGRVRSVAFPVLQTAVAAGIAWLIAHNWLGHQQPFFAPIAAAVSLSTSHVRRARRSMQMILGVLLGIGVSELVHPLLGGGWVSITVVVAVTLVLAVGVGVGFFGEGMMLVNQAAASAILVVALHRAGTGSERVVDALVGGGVALVIGVGMFPVEPLKLLWDAEDGVLGAVLAVLDGEPLPGAREESRGDDWSLAASQEIHRRLSALTAARNTARSSVRVAPRRMRLRALVDAEEQRVSRIYLLTGGSLALARAGLDDGPAGERETAALAAAVRTLLAAERPWSALALEGARRELGFVLQAAPPQGSPERSAAWGAARRVAGDLIALLPAG